MLTARPVKHDDLLSSNRTPIQHAVTLTNTFYSHYNDKYYTYISKLKGLNQPRMSEIHPLEKYQALVSNSAAA
jgi:hypothetical protein